MAQFFEMCLELSWNTMKNFLVAAYGGCRNGKSGER